MGLSKESVNYKIAKKKTLRCSTCDFYYPPGAQCEIVEGNISPDAVCDRWFIGGRSSNVAKGPEFYKRQRRKVA